LPRPFFGPSRLPLNRRVGNRLPARQMVLDIAGDLLADRRQLKQLVLDDRIVGLLGEFPIRGRLVPQIVRPVHCRTIPMSWVMIVNARPKAVRVRPMRQSNIAACSRR
jgi:hypothetical protein